MDGYCTGHIVAIAMLRTHQLDRFKVVRSNTSHIYVVQV
jgi:hypothetical protein